MRSRTAVALLNWLTIAACAYAQAQEARLPQIVDANINATHAFQVLMHQSSGKGDASVWSSQGHTQAELQSLIDHQKGLLATDPKTVKAWVDDASSAFDPAKDLTPLLQAHFNFAEDLPVNVFANYFQAKTSATALQARALATLLQMMLDIERDADVLQQMYAMHVGVGLPVHTAMIGLQAQTDDDFLAVGQELSPKIAASPFATDPATLQMLFRKMWNWGHRYTGERDKYTLANELLAEPDIAALIPRIAAMPRQRIGVVGHSFTMNVHWSSPSAFVPIVFEMIRKHNPNVEMRQWEAGGLTPTRAYNNFYQDVLAWKPNQVLLVVMPRNEEDYARLEEMARGFAAAGTKVYMFDSLLDPGDAPARNDRVDRIASRTGMVIIEVGRVIQAAPDKDKFLALDKIHMTEPYHRLMAKEWLKFLVGAREARLSGREPRGERKPRAQNSNRTGWRVIGPGGGGAMFLPTVNPADPDNVYLRCDMTGGFVTHDGGKIWSGYQLRSVIQDFEFDPADPDTVYAAGTGLFRTTDGGATWALIYPAPDKVVAEMMVGDHAEHSFKTGDGVPVGQLEKVRVDPAVPGRIFLAAGPAFDYNPVSGPRRTGDKVRILISDDKGGTWRTGAEVPGHAVFALLPGDWDAKPNELTVVTESAVAIVDVSTGKVTANGVPGGRLVQAEGGKIPSGTIIYAIGSNQSAPGSLPSGDTVFLSRDRGKTWTPVMNGLASDAASGKKSVFSCLAVCESQGDSVYLSCSHYYGAVNGETQRQFGTLRTDDGGSNWRWVFRASEGKMLDTDYDGGWVMEEYSPEWGEYPLSLGVSPLNPDICYASDFGCTYRTLDGGKTWRQVFTDKVGQQRAWRSRGLDVTNCYGVIFDPADRKHLYVPYTDVGAFHSFDGGESWVHGTNGIPREWINGCYWAVFDPEMPGRVWSVWGSAHDLPRQKMMRRSNLEKSPGGVAVSNDAGRTWIPSSTGMAPSTCTHIVLDPRSPRDSRTLYVSGFGTGVWKSSDGAKNWQKAGELPWPSKYVWRLALTPDGTLFAIVAHGILDGKAVDGAMFKSGDGGKSWTPVALPPGVNFPNDLVLDPGDSMRMYLCLWPRTNEYGREVSGGVLKTQDGGKSWQRIFREDAHVFALAIDPASPATLFINTFDSAAFRSDDGGKTWTRLKGYNFKWGHRPVVDIHNPGMLYLTTFGGGLYHGPASGTPETPGEITNVREEWRWR